MRQLIEKIKERSDKLNALFNCENIDNEQIAEEAKAAYYDVVDLRNTLKSLGFIDVRNNKFEIVHAHNVMNLVCSKTIPELKERIKKTDENAAAYLSFYAIALEGLHNILKDKLKQISDDVNRNRQSNKASDGER